jgi:phosphoadenosine phosphosulfate reductase
MTAKPVYREGAVMSSDGNEEKFRKSQEFLSRVTSFIKGKIALAYSYQSEDTVALDMLLKCGLKEFEVFTLDTKKLFPELAEYHQVIEKFFGISVGRRFPDAEEERKLEESLGEFGMRESLAARRRCCRIRKVNTLARALNGKSAYVTGVRASQSVTRAGIPPLEYDDQFDLIKINPLFDWSEDDVSAYIAKHGLPQNPLYAKGFRSIGCAPCTRPVKEGEDLRAGRWWWESPDQRECGCMIKYKEGDAQNAATIKLG